MSNIVVLIGLPGCGKSTYTKSNDLLGGIPINEYSVHSSDEIRLELGTTADKPHAHDQKVFQILHQRIKDDLKNDKSCIYDATNLSRKKRRAFLQELNRIPCTKYAVLFMEPIDVCKERNSHRKGFARVPDEVYDRMLASFNVPDCVYEGFDEIYINQPKDSFFLPYDNYRDLDHFSQNNPHHMETLGEHMKQTAAIAKNLCKEAGCSVEETAVICEAARWHDIGKVHTKVFHNMKGEGTIDAHYYNHDNVGAYMYLLKVIKQERFFDDKSLDTQLKIANIINWHMIPHTVWKESERRYQNDRMLLSADMVKAIDILHEADKMASIEMNKTVETLALEQEETER